MTAMAAGVARGRGLRIDEVAASEQAKATLFGFAGFEQPMLQRLDPPGGANTIMYALLALEAGRHPADRVTDAMVFNMVAQQQMAGDWEFGGIARPPIADGSFPTTVLSMRALQLYASLAARRSSTTASHAPGPGCFRRSPGRLKTRT